MTVSVGLVYHGQPSLWRSDDAYWLPAIDNPWQVAEYNDEGCIWPTGRTGWLEDDGYGSSFGWVDVD